MEFPMEGMWSRASAQMTVVMEKTQTGSSATPSFRFNLIFFFIDVFFFVPYACPSSCSISTYVSPLIFYYSQVILKPDPGNSQDLFLRSLSALGTDQASFPYYPGLLFLISDSALASQCHGSDTKLSIGINVGEHDIRFVEDNWESPVINCSLLFCFKLFHINILNAILSNVIYRVCTTWVGFTRNLVGCSKVLLPFSANVILTAFCLLN